jgi:CDP-glucose 4,6-dehydratase
MGTVHVLDAVRRTDSVRAVVCVTSDKCYENREWVWPYRESDPMGGHDPYSSSKGAAELVISAYRNSYFPPSRIAEHRVAVASVRAGNVIGGADWAADRLVPDIVRSIAGSEPLVIRNPDSIRPWQHVLEALAGYILLAERLVAGEADMADGWNFGPSDDDTKPVRWIVERLNAFWDRPARSRLGWRPAMDLDGALRRVAEWHRAYAAGDDARDITLNQIRNYRDGGATASVHKEA